ncbi:hypothetical protein AMECASPLE_028329 [Ameca splendens]|uniref:Peptidase A2 domain-containing protein n=1 Tax=Ameca splendens TaxID=208324 RepID=A0ABV0ZQA4_9TELE
MSLLWVSRSLCRSLPNPTKRGGPSPLKGDLTDRKITLKTPRLTLPATLLFNQDQLSLSALIDSRCEKNLIDQSLVQQAKIKIEPLNQPHQVLALEGKMLH